MKKINYTVDKNNIIIEWHSVPFNSESPHLEIADDINIVVGSDKVVDGKLVKVADDTKLIRIAELKSLLASTDYLCLKHADGALSDEEYASTRAQRQAWRDEINELEA